MTEEPIAGGQPALRKRRAGPLKKAWQKLRAPLAQSDTVKSGIAGVIAAWLRFVFRTNRTAEGSDDYHAVLRRHAPSIVALWHGQHLMVPCFRPPDLPSTALVSKSADAELNAMVAARFGAETVRGSGGREPSRVLEKGGARALLALKKALGAGRSVIMIADIPHGTPRDAGLGVVMLARISGRPILPAAYATSRRKVLERTWDKTTLNMPFGRIAACFGEPILVPENATDEELETYRLRVTEEINAATRRAYALVDGSAGPAPR